VSPALGADGALRLRLTLTARSRQASGVEIKEAEGGSLIPTYPIGRSIYSIRGRAVMVVTELAELYGSHGRTHGRF
jgi:hypothetical protein